MPTTPPATVEDFQGLIEWLAAEYHHGAVSAMAGRLGVSVATPNFWRRGVVLPNYENIERLCQAYNLDFARVRALVAVSQENRRRRPVPFTSGAGAAAPLPVVAESPVGADTPPVTRPVVPLAAERDTLSDAMPLIRRARPRPWGVMRGLTHYLTLEIRQQMVRDRYGLRAA